MQPSQSCAGAYVVYLERWIRMLGRDSIIVVKAEDYFGDEAAALKQVDISTTALHVMPQHACPQPL